MYGTMRPRRPTVRFLVSIGFALGFAIRDMMEEDSVIRKPLESAWRRCVDFFKPARKKAGEDKGGDKKE